MLLESATQGVNSSGIPVGLQMFERGVEHLAHLCTLRLFVRLYEILLSNAPQQEFAILHRANPIGDFRVDFVFPIGVVMRETTCGCTWSPIKVQKSPILVQQEDVL